MRRKCDKGDPLAYNASHSEAIPFFMKFSVSLFRSLPGLDYFDRLALSLFFSAALHLFIIFGLHFVPDFKIQNNASMQLDVVLVNSKSASRPQHADVLAQANLDGGGNTDEDRRAKSPLPSTQRDTPDADAEEVTARIKHMEEQAQRLITRLKSKQAVSQSETAPVDPKEQKVAPDTMDLAQRSVQMAHLEAQISREWDAYQKRPRRMFIGARAKEYSLARYEEDWRQKIERVGNLNYPEAAKQKMHGTLRLTVSIKADGSLESVEINRGSGYKVLDAAAIRTVELAAPFSPLPPEVRKTVDILSITRTWNYTRADQLATGGE
jgi:protein TonB